MEGSRFGEGLSPLATSEDIQQRLVRPPRLQSQPSSSCAASPRCDEIRRRNSSKPDVNSELQKKNREMRLEDYLDPDLLSTIRAKIGGKRKHCGVDTKKITKSELKDFDWFYRPGDHYELMALSRSSKISESPGAKLHDKNDIRDLKLISDSIRHHADGREQF